MITVNDFKSGQYSGLPRGLELVPLEPSNCVIVLMNFAFQSKYISAAIESERSGVGVVMVNVWSEKADDKKVSKDLISTLMLKVAVSMFALLHVSR
jgi:hypothetical protein